MEAADMKPAIRILAASIVALALSACGREDAASYMIDGPRHSLSLLRDKPFAWSKGWELKFVTTNMPDCLRRHKLVRASDKNFRLDLYQTFDGGAFIINIKSHWFVTEMKKCQLQKFETPPPEPGTLIGSFEDKEDGLQFVPVAKPAAAPVSKISPAPATSTSAPAPTPVGK